MCESCAVPTRATDPSSLQTRRDANQSLFPTPIPRLSDTERHRKGIELQFRDPKEGNRTRHFRWQVSRFIIVQCRMSSGRFLLSAVSPESAAVPSHELVSGMSQSTDDQTCSRYFSTLCELLSLPRPPSIVTGVCGMQMYYCAVLRNPHSPFLEEQVHDFRNTTTTKEPGEEECHTTLRNSPRRKTRK